MPSDASDWLQFARDDLAAARTLLSDPDIPSRIACFHAQQSAEKALKALLVVSSIPFKRTHDLVVLAGLQDIEVSAELAPFDLLLLHPWAVEARYPGDLPDVSDAEAAEVVATAAGSSISLLVGSSRWSPRTDDRRSFCPIFCPIFRLKPAGSNRTRRTPAAV